MRSTKEYRDRQNQVCAICGIKRIYHTKWASEDYRNKIKMHHSNVEDFTEREEDK